NEPLPAEDPELPAPPCVDGLLGAGASSAGAGSACTGAAELDGGDCSEGLEAGVSAAAGCRGDGAVWRPLRMEIGGALALALARRLAAAIASSARLASIGGALSRAVGIATFTDAAWRVDGGSPTGALPGSRARPIAKKQANTT